MSEVQYFYYDGHCKECFSENCGIFAGLPECVWEAAKFAEEELAMARERQLRISRVADKYSLSVELLNQILEEING